MYTMTGDSRMDVSSRASRRGFPKQLVRGWRPRTHGLSRGGRIHRVRRLIRTDGAQPRSVEFYGGFKLIRTNTSSRRSRRNGRPVHDDGNGPVSVDGRQLESLRSSRSVVRRGTAESYLQPYVFSRWTVVASSTDVTRQVGRGRGDSRSGRPGEPTNRCSPRSAGGSAVDPSRVGGAERMMT